MMHVRSAVDRLNRRYILKSDAPPLGKLRYLFFADPAMAVEDPISFATKLARLGLTIDEVADLEIREPLSSEIAEYAMSRGSGLDAAMEAVETVLCWHIQDLNREIDRLMLHRRLLKRKLNAMNSLVRALYEPAAPRPAM